jgi:predicted MFS family arabinose efflux permease
LLIATAGLLSSGAALAATQPYLSVIALDELGLSSSLYSAAFLIGSLAHVFISLAFGYWGDRHSRIVMMVLSTLVGCLGYGLFYFQQNSVVFLACILFLIPVASTSYSQFFAAIRVLASGYDKVTGDALVSTVRACVSGVWILASAATAAFLIYRSHVSDTFMIASAVCGAAFLITTLFLRRYPLQGTHAPRKKWGSSLAVLFSPGIIFPVLFIGMIEGAIKLNAMFFGLLILQNAGGKASDIGLIGGAVALLEIPFILGWSLLLRRISKGAALGIGALIYCVYLMLVSQAHSTAFVYSVIILNALGASAVLSLSISYLQDLLDHNPGLGSSLLSVTSFLATAASTAIFSFAMTGLTISQVGQAGAVLAAVASVGLLVLSRRSGSVSAPLQ